MALTDKQMQHPRFEAMSDTANAMVIRAAEKHGFSVKDLSKVDVHAGRVVDALTALLLRLEREA